MLDFGLNSKNSIKLDGFSTIPLLDINLISIFRSLALKAKSSSISIISLSKYLVLIKSISR